MTKDELYIKRCLELARQGQYYVAPNPMVGAVLADRQGVIISEGWHRRFGEAHAEVNCLSSVTADMTASATTLYVSLEPCSHYGKTPPCADMIARRKEELKIERVVVGTEDPNPQVAGRGIRKLREAGMEVTVGVSENECRELNRRFFCLHGKQRPYVILKWAQTADGYMGAADRRVVISNILTKQIVHRMRAENMAIMVGTNTAVTDNPRLLNTHWSGRNPIRVLLDRKGRVPDTSRIFSPEAETIVYRDNTEWSHVLADLAERGIHSVLVEGGATLLNHILATGIYDEVHVEVNTELTLREGIKAPEVSLPAEPYEVIGQNKLYSYRV